jgi:myo-inositol-1(or 4)-monophosphatase
MADFITICEKAARAGGQVLLDWRGRFGVREKGPADLVTEADLAAQQTIREILLGEFPDHRFLGEEGESGSDRSESASPYRWIVDPLDGTTNYVHQFPIYSVSVALEKAGEVIAGTVLNPVERQCFTAVAGGGAFLNGQPLQVSDVTNLGDALVAVSFGTKPARDSEEVERFLRVLPCCQAIRRFGSAALNLCYLAAGMIDAYWGTKTKAWDIAAGVLLIREAGGVVTGIEGEPFQLEVPRFAAAASQSLHRELVNRLQGDPRLLE